VSVLIKPQQRYFLKTSDRATRVRVLRVLWDYRSSLQRRNRIEEQIPDAESEVRRLLERIGDTQQPASTAPSAPHIAHSVDRSRSAALKLRLTTATDLDPQQRGYEFERFLKDLFDINGLSGRSSFRLVGEQIDGSFELSGETYLLEAKWKALLTGVADLRAFNGKVEEKTAWTRGLFVSHTGFSEDGLAAFGRGKRIVCTDGLDLYDTLDRGLAFGDVVAKKVRRAAETGKIFVRVRDLFL
jgi:hypothetical protein